MKILSNKKYNDLISKQFRGIFADVNDDNLLRENGLLYGENKELKQEIERLNNIIEDFEIELQREINVREEDTSLEHNTFIIIQNTLKTALKRFRELKGSDKE